MDKKKIIIIGASILAVITGVIIYKKFFCKKDEEGAKKTASTGSDDEQSWNPAVNESQSQKTKQSTVKKSATVVNKVEPKVEPKKVEVEKPVLTYNFNITDSLNGGNSAILKEYVKSFKVASYTESRLKSISNSLYKELAKMTPNKANVIAVFKNIPSRYLISKVATSFNSVKSRGKLIDGVKRALNEDEYANLISEISSKPDYTFA